MAKFFLIIFILVLQASCSTKNQTKELINNINSELNSSYQLKHGDLMAKYDLLQLYPQSNCLNNQEYVLIINNQPKNSNFIDNFRSKYFYKKKLIAQKAHILSLKIAQFINNLNLKYHFLSKIDQHIISHMLKHSGKSSDTNYLNQLAQIDKLAQKIPFLMPEYKPRITSYYGIRKHPINGKKRLHTGIDMAAKSHSPVYAASQGRVTSVSRVNGYGNLIDITIGKFTSRYAHLNKILVKEGDLIIQGQKIAIQGSTGNVTKEHLHFEIRLNNKPINPFDFLISPCKG